MERVGQEHHEAEETEQTGDGAAHRAGGPLALRLKAALRTHFLEGDLHVPAQQIPPQDLLCLPGRRGAEEGQRSRTSASASRASSASLLSSLPCQRRSVVM